MSNRLLGGGIPIDRVFLQNSVDPIHDDFQNIHASSVTRSPEYTMHVNHRDMSGSSWSLGFRR